MDKLSISWQEYDAMIQSFRLAKRVKHESMGALAVFLAIMTAFSPLFFIEDPVELGFKDENSPVVLGGIVFALFGVMLLGPIYTWVAYYVERFTIDGTSLSIRSMLQRRKFDISELEFLRWKAYTNGGSVQFGVSGSKARLDLHGYERKDRLEIIRALHSLVPPELQEGWPMFCHRVALPLRDGMSYRKRIDPSVKIFTFTRSRYDRMLAYCLSLSVVMVFGARVLFDSWLLAVLPVLVIAGWLLLRFSTSREGVEATRITSTPEGRVGLLGVSAFGGALLLPIALGLLGVAKPILRTLFFVFAAASFLLFLYTSHIADKKRKKLDARSAELAPEIWRQGESAASDVVIER